MTTKHSEYDHHNNVGRNKKFEFGESTGKLGLKMSNKTHTDERKMVQLSYLVPAQLCYIQFQFIFINQSTVVWSGEQHQRSRTILWLLRRGGVTTYFFRRTAKNLVAYAISWSLTLRPDINSQQSSSLLVCSFVTESITTLFTILQCRLTY